MFFDIDWSISYEILPQLWLITQQFMLVGLQDCPKTQTYFIFCSHVELIYKCFIGFSTFM